MPFLSRLQCVPEYRGTSKRTNWAGCEGPRPGFESSASSMWRVTLSSLPKVLSVTPRDAVLGYRSRMSLPPPRSRSSRPATVRRGVRWQRWLPPLALVLATVLAGLTLGPALWPRAAPPRVVRGTTTAVTDGRSAIGFMPDGHRDPDPPPSLRERLTDWRYGFRNTFTSYQVGGVPWAGADGAWQQGSVPACLVPETGGQRVELGLVLVRPGADGRPGQVVVVWLRCL
jgi:hypothetical protein